MIHFDFIVSDEDAENIMGCLQNEICKMMEWKMRDIDEGKPKSYIDWYDGRIEYLKELKKKMTNKRCELPEFTTEYKWDRK